MQAITSAKTSLNQIPAIHKFAVEKGYVKPLDGVADIGCGKYDNGIDFLMDAGAIVVGFDPYNRDAQFNATGMQHIESGMVDVAIVANVLNVIAEQDAQNEVIQLAASCHTALFSIYEGNRSGVGKKTSKGWQNNKKAIEYVEAIKQHFELVERKGNYIIARH